LKDQLAELTFGTYDVQGAPEGDYWLVEKAPSSGWEVIEKKIITVGSFDLIKVRTANNKLFDILRLQFFPSEIDPLSVKVKTFGEGKYAVRLDTSSRERTISIGQTFGVQRKMEDIDETDSNEKIYGASNCFFLVADEETANRIARAFRHLVGLAGGKIAPF
jgi:hypothetical protein